jgi:hypothetical protein
MSPSNNNVTTLSCQDYADGTVYDPSGADNEPSNHQAMSTYENVPPLPAPRPLTILDLQAAASDSWT